MASVGNKLGVVFVHGFRSGPSMWDAFIELIGSDPDLAFVDPLPFRYSSKLRVFNPLRQIPTFDNIADSLKEYVDAECEDYQNLMLVSHSQGGLIIQRYLARMLHEGRGEDLSRIRRVVMFACPNNGSDIGLSLRRSWLPFNPQERQLRPLNEQVSETQRIVINQIVNASRTTGHSCKIPFQVYAGETDNIVTPASARSVFPDAAVLPGDHFTIVRPTSRQHRSYSALKRQLRMAESNGPPVETISTLRAETLEVHAAVSPGVITETAPTLTPYLTRAHDETLRRALRTAIDGGRSIFVVLTGDSSTGKTRALYEALRDSAATRPLIRPTAPDDLLEMLASGRIIPGIVLWLNEAQRFLYGSSGERVAAELTSTLERQDGVVAVGTLWSDPYWNELTALGISEDPHGKARSLLTHPLLARRIPVSAELSDEDRSRWRNLAKEHKDRRLGQALAAGASDGRVVQHLSGGPELLRAFTEGPGVHFTYAELAVISAALDARRLGHATPMTADLLTQAADGALEPRHRSAEPGWDHETLRALTTGTRSDGTRVDIRNTLAPLTPYRLRSGAPASYEPADYLDQNTRSRRADQLGSASLWSALEKHAHDPDDLERLATAAWRRGLFKDSFRLARQSILAGHPTVAGELAMRLNKTLDPSHCGFEWIASNARISDAATVAGLLSKFRSARARTALDILLNRNPEDCVNLEDTIGVGQLINSLMKCNSEISAARLAERNPAIHVVPTDTRAAARLFNSLRKVDEEQASNVLGQLTAVNTADAGALAFRIGQLQAGGATQAISEILASEPEKRVDLRNAGALAQLITALRNFGAHDTISALLERDLITHVKLQETRGVIQLMAQLRQTSGAEEVATRIASLWADRIDVKNPRIVAQALKECRGVGSLEAVAMILSRNPVAHVQIDDVYAVSELLTELRNLNKFEAVGDLADRLISVVDLQNPVKVAAILRVLRLAGADRTISVLLARHPEQQAKLEDPGDVAQLIRQLKSVSDHAVSVLLARHPEQHAKLEDPGDVAQLIRQLKSVSAVRAISRLLARHPEVSVSVVNERAVRRLLKQLLQIGERKASDILMRRAMDSGAYLPEHLKAYGRNSDGLAAEPWSWDQLFAENS